VASTIAAGKKIRREYIRVFSIVARAVRESKSKIFLEERVRGAFPRQELFDFILKTALDGRAHAARLVADINKRYIFDALDKVPGHGLSKDKIAAMFDAGIERARVHNSKVFDTVKNVHHGRYRGTGFSTERHLEDDGLPFDYTFRFPYSLSKSVWNTVNHTEEKILNAVWGGIAQGRDIRSVSDDLMVYVRQGPTVIPGRWGKLKPGSAEYVRRFGKAGVDYRAIRIYRSELYRNLQEEAVREARNNPACSGEFDWVRFPGTDFECEICDDLVAKSPYKEPVPAYPHPNCLCNLRPRLKDHDDFINELRAYVNGEPGGEAIERWAAENGLTEEVSVKAPLSPDGTELAREIERGDVDYSSLSNDTAVFREAKWLREQSIDSGNEISSFIGSDNKVLGTFEGSNNEITLMRSTINNLLRNYPAGTVDYIHTHPGGNFFSAADMNMLCRTRGLRRIIVALPNGKSYFLSVHNGQRPSWKTINFTWETMYQKYVSEEKRRLRQRTLLPEHEIRVINKVNEVMANMFDWRFGEL